MADLRTKVYNSSQVAMVLETKDQYYAVRETRKIGAGKHVYLSYRDGLVSCNPNIEITYLIYPAHKDSTLAQTFLPFHLFHNSDIIISYDLDNDKVVLDCVPARGFLERMSISRWLKDLFSG